MKRLFLAAAACAMTGNAFAQDGATFANPSPVNFDRPFLYDAVRVKTIINDRSAPMEVIVIDRAPLAPQVMPVEQWLLDKSKATGSGTSNRDLRAPKAPAAKETLQD